MAGTDLNTTAIWLLAANNITPTTPRGLPADLVLNGWQHHIENTLLPGYQELSTLCAALDIAAPDALAWMPFGKEPVTTYLRWDQWNQCQREGLELVGSEGAFVAGWYSFFQETGVLPGFYGGSIGFTPQPDPPIDLTADMIARQFAQYVIGAITPFTALARRCGQPVRLYIDAAGVQGVSSASWSAKTLIDREDATSCYEPGPFESVWSDTAGGCYMAQSSMVAAVAGGVLAPLPATPLMVVIDDYTQPALFAAWSDTYGISVGLPGYLGSAVANESYIDQVLLAKSLLP